MHLKDFRSRGSRDDVPIGDGAVGYERVLPAALEAGAEWLLVEEDEVERRPDRGGRALARGGAPAARGLAVTGPMRVGVVGCGVIAARYVADSSRLRELAADRLRRPRSRALRAAFASEHDLRAESVDELLADPDVELVLNLTPPAAHGSLSLAALAAGKHVYSEKPLAVSVQRGPCARRAGERLGLRLGCAPDTFLGSAYQAGKRLIEAGAIGTPLGAAAAILVGGSRLLAPERRDLLPRRRRARCSTSRRTT